MEVPVPYPVEKLVEVPVDRIVTQEVPVERIVTQEVPVERIVTQVPLLLSRKSMATKFLLFLQPTCCCPSSPMATA